MANIDQLSIEIVANSEKASDAIHKLTADLNGLSLALNRINTNSITKFANSMSSLATIGKKTDAVADAVDKMSRKLSSSFGIKTKEGMDAVRESMNDLAAGYKKFQASGDINFAEKLGDLQREVEATVKSYARIKKEVDDTTRAVREYVSATNKGTRKISISEVAAEMGDNLKHVQKVLGSNFTSSLTDAAHGVSDLESYLEQLSRETGYMFKSDTLDDRLTELVGVLEEAKNATYSYNEAVSAGQIRSREVEYEVVSLYNALEKLVDVEDGVKTNGIDKIVESLRGLSDVTIPDFTPFAQAIDALNRASTDKVVKNIKAVKQALDEVIPSANDVKTSLDGFGDTFLPAIRECTSLIPSMASGFQSIVPVSNNLNEIIVVMNTELARAGYYIEDMKGKMSELLGIMGKSTSVPLLEDFRSFKPDDIDIPFREIIEMGTNAEQTVQNFGNTTKSVFSNLKDMWLSAFGKPFEDQIRIYDDVNGKLVAIDTTVKETGKDAVTLATRFAQFAEVAEKVSKVSDKLGNLGTKLLKAIYLPLGGVVKEYKEKAEGITRAFANMRKKVEGHFKAMSRTWQRIARTFTFMLVRKAITAVIKDVKEAVDELALFEMKLGTLSGGQFNKSISEILADFHYIGRAIVAAFEPLINYVVPALNAVANAVANVLSLVGEFFAAFTGQNYFVKAKKTVVDYGKEIDDTTDKLKEQKKLLLKIDEINPLQKNNDSNSKDKGNTINYKDAFEEIPVSDKMRGLADKIKEILSKLFDPLKKAWDNVGDYVLRGWKYLWSQIKRLAADIGRDFLTMWNEPETQRLIESILRTVGHLEYGLGRLIDNFADSWEKYGLGIFEKIRDNLLILQLWVEETAKAFHNWARDVNFDNLLSAIDQLLEKTKRLANFLGGVFYDVMTKVVMKFVEFMIEEGLPHLITTIGEVIDAFDFDKIRQDLQILEVAFERMAEQIDIGITNAIGNVGKQLAEWMNSDEFTKFCEALAHFMDLVTAERVEKLFTALGTALLDVAKALADFVSSEQFQKFVDKLIEWYDSKSAEELAGYIEKIATAILVFKFTAFIGPGIAGFFKFIATLKGLSSLGTIAKGLTTAGTAASGAGTAAAAGGTAAAAGIGTIAGAAAVLTGETVSIVSSLGQIKDATVGYAEANTTHSKEVETAMENLKKLYEKSPEMAADWAKTVYDIDISNDSLYEAQNKVWRKIDTEWEGIPQNLFDGMAQGWDNYFGKDGKGLLAYTSDAFTMWVDGLKNLLGIHSPSTVFDEMAQNTTQGFENGFTTGWGTVTTNVLALVGQLITDIGTKLSSIGEGLTEKLAPIKTAFETKFGEIKQTVETKVGEAASAFNKKCGEINKSASTEFKEVVKTTTTKFKELKDAVSDKMKLANDTVRDKLSTMKDKFTKFDLTKMGSNVVRGFLSGLKSAWVSVKQWAAEAVADIKKKFAEALQIKSPSRVFMEYGQYTVEGFNIGLEKESETTGKAVDKWVDSFKDMSVTLMPDIKTDYSGALVSFNNENESSDEMINVMKNLADKIIESNRTVASEIRNNNGKETRVILDLDGRRIYEQVVRQDKQQLLRTGKSSFAY